jgi:hypothetical protein
MKVGPYCGYSLDEIIHIKQKEEQTIGRFYWGYSGVFCRPSAVMAFVSHAKAHQQPVSVLLSSTNSSYSTQNLTRFSQYSVNKIDWQPLPSEVLLVGNNQASHFAFVGRKLKKQNTKINLADYCSFKGMFPDPNKYLDDYFHYRVDKACGYYSPRNPTIQKILTVDYSCELSDPHCVYIR